MNYREQPRSVTTEQRLALNDTKLSVQQMTMADFKVWNYRLALYFVHLMILKGPNPYVVQLL